MPDSHPPLYTPENYSQDESIGFILHQAKVRLAQAIDEEIGGLDVTTAQWAVLKQIAQGNGETATALCRCMGCDTGSMTRMLDRLEEKGLIQRERSTSDRRVVQLSISASGRELLPQLVPPVVRVLNHAVNDFSRDELELTKTLLRRMIANLSRRGS